MSTRLFLLLLFAVFAHAQPPFAPFGIAVRNAALPNTSVVAPGSLIAITPLAPELQSLDGVTAELRVTTDDIRPLPLLPAPNGVGAWALIPKDVTSNPFVTLIRNGVRYTAALFIQPIVPSLFASDYSGFGPAAATSYGGPIPARSALTSAAVPERFVSLYATGLNDARAADVIVDVAGQTVPAVYAGPQGTPGLDQINFIVPKNAYLGCYVPVTIRARGVVSNSVTLSINSDPFACAHPLGLTYEGMRTLDEGGSIPVLSLSIFALKSDNGALSEGGVILSTWLNAANTALTSGVQVPNAEYFTCKDTVGVPSFGGVYSIVGGPSMLLTGPQGRELDTKDNPFLATPPGAPSPFFIAGDWALHSPTGSFSAFDLPFRLPPMILSTNIVPGSTISSERDLEVTWNPAGFGPDAVVIVGRPGRTCTANGWTGHVNLGKPLRAQQSAIQVSVVPHPAARPQTALKLFDGTPGRALVNYNFYLTTTVTVD